MSKTRWMTLVMLLTLIGTTALLSADSLEKRYPSREEILTGKGDDFNYMFLNRYPVSQHPMTEKFDIKGKTPTTNDYSRRTVTWWPRKWVDYIPEDEIPEAAIKRTWTFRASQGHPLTQDGWYRDVNADTVGDGTLEAHFIGFRSIGNDIGNDSELHKITEGPGIAPTVVLRLSDGRLRGFARGMFSGKDQAEMLKLYNKEMGKIRKGSIKLKRDKPGVAANWPAGKMYEPGSMQLETPNYIFLSGAQSQPDSPSPWVNVRKKKETARFRKGTFQCFEDFWAFNEYAGHFMYGWDSTKPVKYFITIPGTMRDGVNRIPGGYGGGSGGCGLRDAGGGPWSLAFFHEWGHGVASGFSYGAGETLCDTYQVSTDLRRMTKIGHQAEKPYKNFFHGQYPGAGGYLTISDDPNWSYYSIASIASLTGFGDGSPMHGYMRVGKERGMWDDPIAEFGDLMGTVCSRFAEFDTQVQQLAKNQFVSANKSYLVAVDREKGLYRCPPNEAPQPYGVHISRLVPGKGAREFTVDFRGFFDRDTYSDWRVCIVAVDKNGVCRYSPMWNKGEMSMDILPGDRRYWLTVTATPFGMPKSNPRGGYAAIYEVGFCYKYPFEVLLKGCTPGTPRNNTADNMNFQLAWPQEGRYAISGIDGQNTQAHGSQCDWPVLPDHPDYEKTIDDLTAMKKRLPKAQDAFNEVVKERWIGEPYGWRNKWIYVQPGIMNYRADYLLENSLGARHKNGGGWVSHNAQVDETAYVGPNAMALDYAQVRDNASIEDFAVVSGEGVTIRDNAKVFGKAIVCGNADVSGYARVSRNIFNRQARVHYNAEELPHKGIYTFDVKGGTKVYRTTPERRERFEFAHPFLQANYAMLRDETILLEDNFYERGEAGYGQGPQWSWLIFYDGQLHGKPTFFKDEQSGKEGFTFDGKTQYAELEPTVLDLGEATVHVALQFKGKGGTLLDAGHNKENRILLTVNDAGMPTLAVTVDGKATAATGNKPLKTDQWSDIRLELSDKAARVFVDNALSAKLPTGFRPCDVIPAGETRRNFFAIDREKKNPLAASVDYVRIYSKVFDDFAVDVKEPPLVSPRRVPGGMIKRIAKFNQRAEKEFKEQHGEENKKLAEMTKFYGALEDERTKIGKEMRQGDKVDALKKQQQELQAKLDAETAKLVKEFLAQPKIVAEKAKLDAYAKEANELRKQIQQSPEMLAIRAKENEVNRRVEDARKKALAELEQDPAYQKLLQRDKETRDAYNAVQTLAREKWENDPKWQGLRDQLNNKELMREQQQDLHRRREKLEREIRNSIPTYSSTGNAANKARDRVNQKREVYLKLSEEYVAATKEQRSVQNEGRRVRDNHPLTERIKAFPRNTLEQQAKLYAEPGTYETRQQVFALNKRLADEILQTAYSAGNTDEFLWTTVSYANSRRTAGALGKDIQRQGSYIVSDDMRNLSLAYTAQKPDDWTTTQEWKSDPAVLRNMNGYEEAPRPAKLWMERMMPDKYGPDKGKPIVNSNSVISHSGSLPDYPRVTDDAKQSSPEELEKKVQAALAMDMGSVPVRPKRGERSYDPPSVKSDPVEQLLTLEAKKWVVPTAKLSMVKIPAGTFMMGSPEKETGRSQDEAQREVTLSKPFYMGVVEVSQEQYLDLMVPDYHQGGYLKAFWGYSTPEVHQGGPYYTAGRVIPDTDVFPMDSVTWDKANAFCEKLNEAESKAGRLPKGYAYRLPTEAEWEYACRAGTKGSFNVEGEVDRKLFTTFRMVNDKPDLAGNKMPNEWGLYDMHGNMYEWCLDMYGPYDPKHTTDPVRKAGTDKSETRRIARGGCFLSNELTRPTEQQEYRYIRSASRNSFRPDSIYGILGFRVVLAPKERNIE
ncbi:SUMF1/EgtB/PvdO family nonheme iron enzyme [Candidatus Sumerlaeota bacterium]